jgi:ADP-ribose pyrophosphatase
MQQWKTLSRTVVLEHNKFLSVESHKVQLPNGTIIPDWPWVVSPDYVLVLPMTPENTFLCFRQVKYAVEGTSLAPVGGHIEPGEDPLLAAQRELREEMGCVSDEWIPLGTFHNNGNHGAGMAHLYLARGVSIVAQPTKDDLEEMEMQTITRAQLEDAVTNGAIKVISWQTVAALSLLYLQKKGE